MSVVAWGQRHGLFANPVGQPGWPVHALKISLIFEAMTSVGLVTHHYLPYPRAFPSGFIDGIIIGLYACLFIIPPLCCVLSYLTHHEPSSTQVATNAAQIGNVRSQIVERLNSSLPENLRTPIISALAQSYARTIADPYYLDWPTPEARVQGHLPIPNLERVIAAQQETIEIAVRMLTFLEVALPLNREGPFRIEMIDAINNFGYTIDAFIAPLFAVKSPGLFRDLQAQIQSNVTAISLQKLKPAQVKIGMEMWPREHPGPPREILKYLKGTDFEKVFS